MSDRRPLYRNRLVRGVAAGTGAALAAGWAAQHRLVARTQSTPDDIAAEGLTVPEDCTTTSSTSTTGVPSTSSSAVRALPWCCCTDSC